MKRSFLQRLLWGFAVLMLVQLPALPVDAATYLSSGNIDVKGGYRQDELAWSIAADETGASPNILSELKWEDLEIYQVQGRFSADVGDSRVPFMMAHIRGMVGFGAIEEGKNQDSDYAGDDRSLEWSRSNNGADDGDVLDFSIGAGLRFNVLTGKLSFLPMVGYSWHEQNLAMRDGVQTLSDQAIVDALLGPGMVTLPPLGPFSGLNSSYDAEWSGPWAGFEVAFKPVEKVTIKGTFEYHWADFDAKANWNLRSDFAHPVSFIHTANGDGIVFEGEAEFALSEDWALNVSGNYQDWETDPGDDRTFFSDNSYDETRLNEVEWESWALMGGVKLLF